MPVDIEALSGGLLGFYLSVNVLAALVGAVPGALVERKACATLERVHFLMFFFGGLALIVYLQFEIARGLAPENHAVANAVLALVAGFYLSNVTARRLRNAAKRPILALLIWVPVVNVAFMVLLATWPTAPKKVRERAARKSATLTEETGGAA